MKSSRNRSCCKCKCINIFFKTFKFFFMSNTKTLFFIYNYKS